MYCIALFSHRCSRGTNAFTTTSLRRNLEICRGYGQLPTQWYADTKLANTSGFYKHRWFLLTADFKHDTQPRGWSPWLSIVENRTTLTDFFAFHSSNEGILLRGEVGRLSSPREGEEVGVAFLPWNLKFVQILFVYQLYRFYQFTLLKLTKFSDSGLFSLMWLSVSCFLMVG